MLQDPIDSDITNITKNMEVKKTFCTRFLINFHMSCQRIWQECMIQTLLNLNKNLFGLVFTENSFILQGTFLFIFAFF